MSNSESNRSLSFSVKVGKSYKNKGWALNRESSAILFPKLSYEDECDIIVDGIHSKARLNVVPRIFYNNNPTLINHLKKLSDEGIDRIDLELLLNHDNLINDFELNDLLIENNNLNHELQDKDFEIIKLNEEIRYLKSFKNGKDEELEMLHSEISELKNIIRNQDTELDNLFSSIIQLELDNEESFKKRENNEEENKKLNKKLEKLYEALNNN